MPAPLAAPLATTLDLDRKALRRLLRARRRALSAPVQRAAALRVAAVVARRPEFVSANHVAVYLAADGELDPLPLVALARAAGKQVYLPVLQPGNGLRFAVWREGALLRANRFGLREPVAKRFRAAARLDLVRVPLVGFDRRGARLGMGGGFYDRSFAFLAHGGRRRPHLVGLAHACQEVAALGRESRDVPLAAIATVRGWIS